MCPLKGKEGASDPRNREVLVDDVKWGTDEASKKCAARHAGGGGRADQVGVEGGRGRGGGAYFIGFAAGPTLRPP